MKPRTSGAATFVKTSGTPTGHSLAPKSTIPTCTAGLASVSGPPLSPWHVDEVEETAHSSTAELSPTPPRQASLLIAVRFVEYRPPLELTPSAPCSLPYPLIASVDPGVGVAPGDTREIGSALRAADSSSGFSRLSSATSSLISRRDGVVRIATNARHRHRLVAFWRGVDRHERESVIRSGDHIDRRLRRVRRGRALVVDTVGGGQNRRRAENRAAATRFGPFCFVDDQDVDLPRELRDRRFLPVDDLRNERPSAFEGIARRRSERLRGDRANRRQRAN